MSKKNFVLMALVINFTICLTLCISAYTNKNGNSSKKVSNSTKLNLEINSDALPADTNYMDETTSTTENSSSEETTTKEPETSETSSKIEERAVVSSETQPVKYNLSTTVQGETTSIAQQETQPMTQPATVAVNGTTATINSSCNIHSVADTGNNIGTANAGMSYAIDASKCTSNWTAIILPDGSVGYVASSYCTIH